MMIALNVEIPQMPRRIRSQFMKELKPIMLDVGKRWHQKFRPKHFARGAHSRYGYKKRDPEYLKQKERKRGPRPDLVYFGRTNRYTAHGERITATSRQVTIRMDLPNYKSPVERRKQLQGEITSVNNEDRSLLAEYYIMRASAELRKILKDQ